uniref:Uncharacterized protein n=1 Tax=Globodera pallida TaxID=36090 RepID=A0A183BQU1_GLOPA
MDTNFEHAQEEQQLNRRILCLQRKCKQLEEINAQFCDEDDERLKQIDAIEEENRALKRDNAFKAKQIQQEREENLQLKEALEEEQKKAVEMVLRNAVRIRIGYKASCMKSPSGASTSSSSSRSSWFSSSQRLDDEDANVVEGRDSGNFSDQDQQDSVGNAGSGKLLSNVPEVGNCGGMPLVEELELAEQQQKMKEELDKTQLEQHQQQNMVEEPELAVQHQQQNNNNSHIPHGAPPHHFLLSLLILLCFFVLIVLVVPSVQRGQLVIRISVFFPSAMKLTENVVQSKVVGVEQQHLQQQLVPALSERVEQLELELKETNIKFGQQLEELETIQRMRSIREFGRSFERGEVTREDGDVWL